VDKKINVLQWHGNLGLGAYIKLAWIIPKYSNKKIFNFFIGASAAPGRSDACLAVFGVYGPKNVNPAIFRANLGLVDDEAAPSLAFDTASPTFAPTCWSQYHITECATVSSSRSPSRRCVCLRLGLSR